jgi:hypothetical protein
MILFLNCHKQKKSEWGINIIRMVHPLRVVGMRHSGLVAVVNFGYITAEMILFRLLLCHQAHI